jgi:hypothetical protein
MKRAKRRPLPSALALRDAELYVRFAFDFTAFAEACARAAESINEFTQRLRDTQETIAAACHVPRKLFEVEP